jgi:hypothetical protein
VDLIGICYNLLLFAFSGVKSLAQEFNIAQGRCVPAGGGLRRIFDLKRAKRWWKELDNIGLGRNNNEFGRRD